MPGEEMGQERGLGNWGWEWLTAGDTSLALQPGPSIPSPFRRARKEREGFMSLVPPCWSLLLSGGLSHNPLLPGSSSHLLSSPEAWEQQRVSLHPIHTSAKSP